jgi:hypothetical protein
MENGRFFLKHLFYCTEKVELLEGGLDGGLEQRWKKGGFDE